MVVAEIPLWVIHNNNSNDDEAAAFPSSSAAAANGTTSLESAQRSLDLLVQKSNKKCAIYSIDIHPNGTTFATAGGDGKLRLWNTKALFVNNKTKHPPPRGAHFDDRGQYVSSSSGSSGSSGEDESRSGDDNNSDQHEQNGRGGASNNNPVDETNSLSDSLPEVHDLNAVARRKKDGSTIIAASPAGATSRGSGNNTNLSPSPTNKQHHGHHHRLLCTLSAHTGSSVLAVRFSNAGQFLASAGDDACVCIYTCNKHHNHNHNIWSRTKLCRGHGLDVVDLAWAPDDSHLVSCSLDKMAPIIVWKMASPTSSSSTSMICHPYKILGQNIHTSTVKGVTFDPAGSYLASSGDDPAVCVWRAHDDWGLEARIDDGIFRKWNTTNDESSNIAFSQSLFRRISWSTDGAFICSTNSVVKNKHVASAISREGWAVSGGNNSGGGAAGAANLVGHKQPVVASRHAPQLLRVRRNRGSDASNSEDDSDDDDEEEGEPEHATLLALGDRRGFVTIWTTKKSRPIFKLQCSESHCTVTDLSWGALGNGDLMLLVSLLDGQVVALRFAVPGELGELLTKKEKARIFQLRYGIDLDDGDNAGGFGQRRLFVGDNSAPKLIENPLQMTLEEEGRSQDSDKEDSSPMDVDHDGPEVTTLVPRSVKDQQQESQAQGKKRIRPVLMQVETALDDKRTKVAQDEASAKPAAPVDPLQNAVDAVEKIATATESANASKEDNRVADLTTTDGTSPSKSGRSTTPKGQQRPATSRISTTTATVALPHSTDSVHVVDLPLSTRSSDENGGKVFSVTCRNTIKVPTGSKGNSVACIDIAITSGGKTTWKDQIPGTSCSAISACQNLLAVGTADGVVQLFGTSPSLGWTCGASFRSHPPLVFGNPVVALQLKEQESPENESAATLEMLVVAADGTFGVYTVLPHLSLQYKGSILPLMKHMSLSCSGDQRLPKLSRAQLTESGRLLVLLSFDAPSHRSETGDRPNPWSAAGTGGTLQAFVYERPSELWLRVSDSRFVLSDFYSALPGSKRSAGPLSRMDDSVRMGSLHSTLKSSHRMRLGDRQSDGIYDQIEEDLGNFVASRSHCEDRMACALALGSGAEFKSWLAFYVRTLAVRGQSSQLRTLIDMIVGRVKENGNLRTSGRLVCWWLSKAPTILNLDRVDLIKTLVIPEMSKNRALQRMTNEVSMEIDALT